MSTTPIPTTTTTPTPTELHDAAAMEVLGCTTLKIVPLYPTYHISITAPNIKTELIKDALGVYITRCDDEVENSIISGYCSDEIVKLVSNLLIENEY